MIRMNKHTSLVSGLVVGLLVIGAGCAQVAQKNTMEDDAVMKKDDAMMEDRGATMMKEEGKQGETMESTKPNESMMKKDDAMMKDGSVMKDEKAMMEVKGSANVEGEMMAPKDGSMMKDDSMMKSAQKGSYESYGPEKLAYAKAGGHVVLFFHAPWCPTCRAANESLTANAIPQGLLVLKTDYDSSTELKKKYGVTSQHTFVQVDANGTMIKKWLGSTTATDIAAQIK